MQTRNSVCIFDVNYYIEVLLNLFGTIDGPKKLILEHFRAPEYNESFQRVFCKSLVVFLV